MKRGSDQRGLAARRRGGAGREKKPSPKEAGMRILRTERRKCPRTEGKKASWLSEVLGGSTRRNQVTELPPDVKVFVSPRAGEIWWQSSDLVAKRVSARHFWQPIDPFVPGLGSQIAED